MNVLTEIQRTILNILANELFHADKTVNEQIDWNALWKESVNQTVNVITYSGLPDSVKKSDAVKKWSEQSMYVISNNVFFNYEHIALNKLMKSIDVPYVVLKGRVSASYYPYPLLRVMGDVDFLVDKSDVSKVDAVLKKNGFELQPESHEVEKIYHRKNSVWEMHWSVNGVPAGEVGKKINEYFDTLIDDAVKCETESGYYMRPSVFHHGLIMLLHTARHMTTGGIGLRQLCDWAVFVESVQDDFTEMFEQKLKEIGLWRFAQLLTQLSVKYLGITPQPWLGETDDKLLSDMILDIFEGGNFGQKDMNRSDQAKFITSRKKGTVNNDSSLKQAVFSANEIVRKHWSFADKVPIIYPFGWVFFGGRYMFRALIGKRKKIQVKELVDGANIRKEIYKQMHLFEKNNGEVI